MAEQTTSHLGLVYKPELADDLIGFKADIEANAIAIDTELAVSDAELDEAEAHQNETDRILASLLGDPTLVIGLRTGGDNPVDLTGHHDVTLGYGSLPATDDAVVMGGDDEVCFATTTYGADYYQDLSGSVPTGTQTVRIYWRGTHAATVNSASLVAWHQVARLLDYDADSFRPQIWESGSEVPYSTSLVHAIDGVAIDGTYVPDWAPLLRKVEAEIIFDPAGTLTFRHRLWRADVDWTETTYPVEPWTWLADAEGTLQIHGRDVGNYGAPVAQTNRVEVDVDGSRVATFDPADTGGWTERPDPETGEPPIIIPAGHIYALTRVTTLYRATLSTAENSITDGAGFSVWWVGILPTNDDDWGNLVHEQNSQWRLYRRQTGDPHVSTATTQNGTLTLTGTLYDLPMDQLLVVCATYYTGADNATIMAWSDGAQVGSPTEGGAIGVTSGTLGATTEATSEYVRVGPLRAASGGTRGIPLVMRRGASIPSEAERVRVAELLVPGITGA